MKNITALTDSERKLVEENHNLIYKFAVDSKIDADEYYDVLAIGLCTAAKLFDPTHGTKFSTFAYRCMRTELFQTMRGERAKGRRPAGGIVSYNAEISDGDTYLDYVSGLDGRYEFDVGNAEVAEYIERLSPVQQQVLNDLLKGETMVSIAKRSGYSRQRVHQIKKELQNEWLRYACSKNAPPRKRKYTSSRMAAMMA